MATQQTSSLSDSDLPPEDNSGEYVVVARRYRPQNFEQLVGQGQVSQALGNAIMTGRVGHAYLFTGARGVGKTSTARIFAKALNCVNGPTIAPCGQCDICQGIAAGEDIDVLEIDGASNRGIDEIRQLRQNVNVRPSRARFKIYIIDEVHMLTNQAFNALLKTLEEPPEHVKFIFCTTEADKIPITVLSRCQRFDFAPIEASSILGRLREIATSEQVEIEDEALQILARRANGSMRDSQSLLEQLFSFGGKKIATADVHAMLGTAKTALLSSLVETMASRNAGAALAEVAGAVRDGVDLGQLAEQLVGHFRDIMAAQVGCSAELLLHNSASDLEKLAGIGQQLGIETVLAMVQILDQAVSRMRQSTHTRTLLEVAIVRICKLEDLDQLPQLVAQLRGGVASGPVAPRVSSPAAAPRPYTPPAVSGGHSGSTSEADQKKTAGISPGPNSGPSMAPPAATTAGNAPSGPAGPSISLTPENLKSIWGQALARLEDMTADHARQAESVAISGPNRLVIRFPRRYTFAKQNCDRPDRRARLAEAVSSVVGASITIDTELLPEDHRSPGGPAQRPAPPTNRRQRFRDAERHALVKQAMEIFDGEILTVLEPPPGPEPTEAPSPTEG